VWCILPLPCGEGDRHRRHLQANGTRAGCRRWGADPRPLRPPPGRTRSFITLSFVLLPVMAVPGLDPGIRPGHPAFRLTALILRSRCKPRLEGGVQCSVDTPSRRSLTAAPQDEGERDERDHRPGHPLPSWPGLSRPSQCCEAWSLHPIGIAALLDTLPRHGRSCPGHPDPVRCCALRIGITGTSPVMTWRV
jgi:hypothetical protein